MPLSIHRLIARLLFLPFTLLTALLGSTLLLFTPPTATIGLLLLALGIGGLYALSLSCVADRLLRPLEEIWSPFDADARCADRDSPAFIAVLGGGFSKRAQPPAIGRLQSAGLARLCEGVRIARLTPVARLIVCAYPCLRDESVCLMREAAIELGLSEQRVQVVEAANSTRSELQSIARLVDNQPVILVTSASHMSRATRISRQLGLKVEPAPTDFRRHPPGSLFFLRWLPSSYELTKSERALYEYLALIKERWRNGRTTA